MDVVVTSEPRVYTERSPYSFFKDLVAVTHGDAAAQRRLAQYQAEVDKEIADWSPEGQRNYRARVVDLRRRYPHKLTSEIEQEARAASSTTMPGFTTPQYILDQFAKFRGSQRAFVDQTTKIPLPNVGLDVDIPSFTSTASAGVQTEGSAVAEADPSGQSLSAHIQTIAGQITVSQQLEDRANAQGFTFDAFAYLQLRQMYDQSVNIYVLGQALAQGASIAQSASAFSIQAFYQDLAACRESLYDTAGTRLPATHVFTTADLYGYATRQFTTSGRPILAPQFIPGNPLWKDSDATAWKQFTGTVLPGSALWFIDEGIQPRGSDTLVIVSRPETIVTMEGDEPLLRVYDQTIAQNLQTVIQLYNYVVAVPRFPKATAYVTGSAYSTTLV